ncbi:MAG: AbrB/MazE/SpoVT family DNA-binding domain-containing protein [Nanoarchaeota archaeon]
MKRKVIQIANSTQLISLPRKWSLKYNIQKGDELEVEEQGNTIVVSTERDVSSSRIQIDFRGKDALIHRALSSLYRAGYDEISIMFEKPSELKIIQSTINQELIGFEVIEETKDNIIVKQVSKINQSEFESMLRRIFIFLVNTSDEISAALKSGSIDDLNNLVLRDITINKLTDYCRRALNKKESYFKHLGPGYVIIEILEKISDGYRDLCKYTSKNKVKISKPILDALYEINLMLRTSQKLFYSFNLNEMQEFLVKRDKINSSISELAKNTKKGEAELLIYLKGISDNIFYLNGPIMINGL